ncbi:hypothetical protein ACFWWB_19760 [Streptomyces sp. NPDC058690]|uniref:hypothetical protein n=1 Tax=Streptomyces sp. NPDC058690 TaxID=3346600 RepID=UPI00366081BC
MVAFVGKHLHFKTLEQALRDRHPELADRVHLDDMHRLTPLKVTLSDQRSAALIQVRMGYTNVWALLDPIADSEPSVWPLDTPNEVLVDALHAAASARLADVPVPSPWRWNESEPSDMTELADLLDTQGLRVRRVVAGNGYFPRGPRDSARLDIFSGRDGHFIEAEFPGAFVRVTLKPALGWLIDAYFPERGTWDRIDLGWNLWRKRLPVPGVPRADASVAEIADVLGKGLKAWNMEVPKRPVGRRKRAFAEQRTAWQTPALFAVESSVLESPDNFDTDLGQVIKGAVPRTSEHSPNPQTVTSRILEQLSTFGFGDLEEGDDELPTRSETFHFVWHNRAKNISTSEIQQLNGLAAAAGENVPKRLIVVTSAGISRPAAEFADTAKAFVFWADPASSKLTALNSRAEEACLHHTKPTSLDLEPW